eukprot:Gb_22977 [translate_table: standard]
MVRKFQMLVDEQRRSLLLPSSSSSLSPVNGQTSSNNTPRIHEYVELNSLISTYDRSQRRKGLGKTIWSEIKAQCKLAAPTIGATVIQYLFTVISELMAGHLGKFELAALAIACTVVRGIAYGIMAATFYCGCLVKLRFVVKILARSSDMSVGVNFLRGHPPVLLNRSLVAE